MDSSRMDNHKRVYFPNLNGLRAIGACIVLIGHIEFLKIFWKLPSYQWFPVPGKIGVALFFAISGFLITSLLIQELDVTKTVALKKFYTRRILRIWPLYYLIIILSIFVFNQIDFLKFPGLSHNVINNLSLTNIIILILLLPNFTNYFIPYADQRWSIIVEEQFYLMQPILIKVFKNRIVLAMIFIVIVLSPNIFDFMINKYFKNSFHNNNLLYAIITQLKYLSCIALGCFFSILFFKKENKVKRFFFNKAVQYIVLIILIVCVSIGHFILFKEEVIDYRIYTFLFSIIVLNACQNPRTIFRLEYPIFNFLGKISYGIYMYHPVCIGLSLALASSFTNIIAQNFILYVLSISLTIFISWVSFTYFESSFLKLKSKFEILKTSPKSFQ